MANPISLIYLRNEDTNTPIVALGDASGQLHVVLAAGAEGDAQELLIDPETNALVVIDFHHYEIHRGGAYQSSYKSPDASAIPDNNNIELFIIVPAGTEMDAAFGVSAGGDAEIELRESVLVSDNGTVLARSNMLRRSANVAQVQTFHTPTITGEGTRLSHVFLPGGTGGQTVGALTRGDTEWNLAPGRTYLLRGINRAGTAQPMSLLVQWSEEDV